MKQEIEHFSSALDQEMTSAKDPANYATGIVKMLQAELGVPIDIWVRYALVIVGSFLLMLAMPWHLPLMTLTVYLGTCATFLIYARTRGPFVGRTEYIIGHGLYNLQYAVYCGCCLFFWFQPSAYVQTAAILGLIGALIYAFERSTVLYSTTLINALLLFASAMTIAFSLPTSMVSWALPLIVFLAFIYIFTALHNRYLAQARLNESMETSAQLRKMEAVGRLSGGIAHEFNNILTAVMGNLELYKESQDPAERDELVHSSRLAAQRAANLTAQLLSYSGKAPLRPELIDVPQLLESFVRLTDRLMPQGFTVQRRDEPALPAVVSVDRTGLNNALLNLVYNARDAMPGGGEITLSQLSLMVSPDDSVGHPLGLPPGAYVGIMVEDGGAGIPRELRQKVVEPFFSTKVPHENPGLGLPMVLGFAEQSGGALEFDTSASGGAAVTLILPLTQKTIPPGFGRG